MTTELDPRWEAFAAREPYFAVLTAPRFLRANLTSQTEREFFDSGEALVDSLFRLVEFRLAPDFAPTSILEYGCGVGRLAFPLARRAARRGGSVTAVDRSPAMLEIAKREARCRGLTNIDFRTPSELIAKSRMFDFVTCYLVLQRLPPERGLALVADLIERLVPGGIGVFQIPFRATAPRLVQASRWLRQRVPVVNGLVNTIRRRPFNEPLVGCHIYNLADVFHLIENRSVQAMQVVFEPHEGLDTALLFAEIPMTRPAGVSAPVSSDGREVESDRPVDVSDMIARTSLEELNQRAEEYFASVTDREHHLTKPFSLAHETPSLLIDIAILLHGLQPAPGSTVLEFGAGTGWLSRFMTQLGCRMILLDVSPTALGIARELYERLPIIGDRPEPRFLPFDGRHIDLADKSVDRIISFHAFHHVPNPAAILQEFGRVLAPGGIAGFAEPGPRHSRSPFSQFEMRTFGVVENDVDVHDIWRIARSCGFREMRIAVFHGPPFQVSLPDYEDFLAGGPTTERWVASTRVFLRNARTFFLIKEGVERTDSRRADGLACEIHATLARVPAIEGEPHCIDAIVTNSGTTTWLASDAAYGGVGCGAHLYDESGRLVRFDLHVEPLVDPPRAIAPDETVRCRVTLPPLGAGRYIIELDCVAARVSWFAPLGSHPARVPVEVLASR